MVHLPRPFRSSASNGTAKTSKESKESSKPVNSSDTVDRNKEESAVSGSIDGGTMERLGVEREGTAMSEGIMIPSIPPISRVSSRDKVPVGKRDRRRSTEVMMSSTEDVQEGMAVSNHVFARQGRFPDPFRIVCNVFVDNFHNSNIRSPSVSTNFSVRTLPYPS
jgi:hypothetical protein